MVCIYLAAIIIAVTYIVLTTDAPSRHHNDVAIFYCSEPHFAVEAVEKFGPNVIGF